MDLFYIFKFTTERLSDSGYDINITVAESREKEEIIAIGDNQVLNFIRSFYNKSFDKLNVKMYYKLRDEAKKLPTSDESIQKIISYQNEIDKSLFVSDLVNIKVDNKKTYKKITKDGFTINGIKYVRLACGSGQSRRNTVTFINEKLFGFINKKLLNGLKIKEINVSKFNAYYGLYMSAIDVVRTPRVCVIKDCELKILGKKIDFVVDKDYFDKKGKLREKREIEERVTDLEMNVFDGQGLISPEMAENWSKDLNLKFTACQFIIRASWIKGMLNTFDFKTFAKEVAKVNTITDLYGKEWNIDDIDVVLTASQFKMHKYYKSWDEYTNLCKENGHVWGVTRFNKKIDDEYSLLNYQYLQTLDLDKEKIRKLSEYTVEWIKGICSGDKLHILLFLLGHFNEVKTVDEIASNVNNDYVKAVLYNDKLLQDPFILKKVYGFIEKKINEAKIGRLWTRGNYQMMVSDPYALCEHAFGMQVKGLLNEFEHYSNFWNDRNIDMVDGCRSPMVDFHEHNLLHLKKNELTEKWYKHMYSGIVYNIWGVDTIRHSDSDFDGDIVFTTSDSNIIQNIIPDKNVITYNKTSAPAQRLNKGNVIQTDLRSFDSKVGAITNYSTTFLAMLAGFKKGSKQYNELIDRIKLLRRYIGDSIDVAKGVKMKPFPAEWKSFESIEDTDTPEQKTNKYYHNSMVAKKKPYFMIYIYEKLMEEYKAYKKHNDRACKEQFNCKINDLVRVRDNERTEDENKFIKQYFYKMPVIKTNCVINQLCWHIEDMDFDLKYNKTACDNEELISIMTDKSIVKNNERFKKVEKLFLNYYNLIKRKFLSKIFDDEGVTIQLANETSETVHSKNDFFDLIRGEALKICSNISELANYAVELNYSKYPTKSKDFVWYICNEGLTENIRKNRSVNIEVPMLDENGIEYLGKKYSLKKI